MLLYAGANVRATTRLGGWTPLLMASRIGHAAGIETLLAGGADPNVATTNGTTALMLAAASGEAAAVRALLEGGAEVNARESVRDQTALMFAAAFNRVEAMNALIAAGAELAVSTKVVDVIALSSAGEDAFLRNQQAAATQPAESGTGPPAGASTERPSAAGGGYAAESEAGSRQGPARPDREQATPAGPDQAAAKPEEKAEEKKPEIPGVTRPFRFAELVAKQGGLTPLLFAARQGHVEAVDGLLEAGADLNQVSASDQISPLLISIVNGHFDLALALLEKGADPTLASENGVTPLYAALNVQWAPNRAGQTTVDMANGPVQRTQPFPETIALLEGMGATNNHQCKSC